MAKKILSETLKDLSSEEFETFRSHIESKEGFPVSLRTQTELEKTEELVELMVATHRRDFMDLTKTILTKMKRMDLVEKLFSSGAKGKQYPSLTQSVEAMESLMELLMESLADLSDGEFGIFCSFMTREFKLCTHFSYPWKMMTKSDVKYTVFSMVQQFGQKSLEKVLVALKDLNRTDLVQRLSGSSSGPKKKDSQMDERQSALIHKVATMAAVKELLSEILSDFSFEEQSNLTLALKSHLFTLRKPLYLSHTTLMAEHLVNQLVNALGQDSVKVFMEAFRDMNRTDLVLLLSETSSGPEKQDAAAGHQSVRGSMEDVENKAVERMILNLRHNLTRSELEIFKLLLPFTCFQKSLSQIEPNSLKRVADVNKLVYPLVIKYGDRTLEVTKEVLMDMNRTDLVEMLSASGSQGKQYPSLTQSAEATMAKKILSETLKDLSSEEFETFRSHIESKEGFPVSLRTQTELEKTEELVELMVATHRRDFMDLTKTILTKMKRMDLVEKLFSSGAKGKQYPSLTQSVEAMESLMELLMESLADLSHEEFRKFCSFVAHEFELRKRFSNPWWIIAKSDVKYTVISMVQQFGQKSLGKVLVALKHLNRTDVVQRLSGSSSGPKKKDSQMDERQSALIHKVATMAAVKELLSEILSDFSFEEQSNLKLALKSQYFTQRKPLYLSNTTLMAEHLVNKLVNALGQDSVKVFMEAFRDMNRTDLVLLLSETSSGPEEQDAAAGHQSVRGSMEDVKNKAVERMLLKWLHNLTHSELEIFKLLLPFTCFQKSLSQIKLTEPGFVMDVNELVHLLMIKYGDRTLEVTKEVLMDMNRTDLVEMLSASGSQGCSASANFDFGMQPDSSGWTELKPKVSGTGADEASTYSLQSEAGRFECSVSGLRWVCKGQVAFKYQFCSWEEPMDRMESRGYMPAGPLIDITIITGKLDEVYLPHWICLHDDPKVSDKFAVLHIEDCGDVVEKVSEVTASHIKLSEPVFSPRAALMKAGFRVKINCKVLIYKIPPAFLTLHVYLIPSDPGLEQELNKSASSYGYNIIRKPQPVKSLKMRDRFILTADLDVAEIEPKELKLKYEGRNSHFLEVYIKNPNKDFKLFFTKKTEQQPVWIGTIREDEFKHTGFLSERDSVEQLSALMLTQATIKKTDGERILETLDKLTKADFKRFKWCLRNTEILEGCKLIPHSRLEKQDRSVVADLLFRFYNQQSVEATRRVLIKINRNDLVEIL